MINYNIDFRQKLYKRKQKLATKITTQTPSY